jgi:uncharacterized membrane protein YphA (DoxX/SURF4 family)/methylglyoxal synthase
MKYVIAALRIIVGCLFIFSGVVKANDPLGLVYKMNEFFEVWNMNFMLNYTLAMSVLMIAFEIISGVAMLVGNAFRLWVTLLLLLNIFFTFLTGYALYSGKIKECGCFGACIKISNTATFYKDIILTAMALILFAFRNRVHPIFKKPAINATIVTLGAIFAFGLQWWTLHHGPINDCMPYKPGNNIYTEMQPGPGYEPAVYETKLVYEKGGQKQEFDADKIPWQDTTWKFVSSTSKEVKAAVGEPEIHDFVLNDSNNNDQTQALLTAKGYTFFWFVRDPEKGDKHNLDRIKALMNKAKAMNIPFYILSSTSRDLFASYLQKWDMKSAAVLTLDVTASKTAMRTDPGLMLMKDGVVQQKWSYLDYPKDIVLDNGKLEFK